MKELFLLIFIGFLCHVNSTPIKPNDDTKIDYRLNSDFNVDSYKLVITTGNLEEDKTFKGTVDIKLLAIKDTTLIKLHVGQNLVIDKTKVSVILKDEDDENKDNRIEIDDKTSYTPNEADIITIILKETIKKDKKIVLKFESFQSEFSKDLYGFYLTTFDGKNGKVTIAATQFQPTHARKVFPCLDEPKYKARFDINIVHTLNYAGISNQYGYSTHQVGDKVATSIFEVTPRISTYSVAFAVVTNFESNSVVHVDEYHCGNFGVELCLSYIYTQNANRGTDYALEETPKIVKKLNDFTEKNYWTMNMRSLKLIAIPDLAGRAMENWGLVTLRSNALLIDEDKSTERDKQDVSTTIAHEFAHMWFGNYVTLDWWDYTWLNEGFATFFAYFITDLVKNGGNEAWNMEQQFIVEKMQPVLLDDGFENTKSLNYPVEKPNEILAKFDSISFNKGASIIRMLKYAVGDKEFQKAIAKYFSGRKENVTPKDLYEVFDESGKTKWAEFMGSWTTQAGYPLITVRRKGEPTETPTEKPTTTVPPVKTKEQKNEVDDDEKVEDQVIEIRQERFLYKHDMKEKNDPKNIQLWKIWLTYATKEDNKTIKSVDFDGETHELTIPNQDLPIFNVDQTGYYRVKYEGGLLNELKNKLKAKDTSISTINRAQIVDDYMNFARAGKISYDEAFEVISFLENEVEYLPWYAALNSFSFLRKRFTQENTRKKINVQMRKLMVTVVKEIKNENRMENHFDMLRKVLILEWCTEVNEKTCIAEVRRVFEMYKIEENWIPPTPPTTLPTTQLPTTTPPTTTASALKIETRKEAESKIFVNWRGLVLCSGLRISDNEDDWNFVKDLLKTKTFPQEQARIITALGCTKNIDNLKEYLQVTLHDKTFRKQDKIAVFNAVLTGNPEGVDVASKFLQKNLAAIKKNFEGVNVLSEMINNVADRLTTEAEIGEFIKFLDKNKDELNVDISQVKEVINTNKEWVEANKDTLEQFYEDLEDDDNDDGAASITISTLLLLLTAFFIKNL